MTSYAVLDRLRGGDWRSIGRANAVARAVLRRPGTLPELAAGLWHADPVIRVRAADALEKVSRAQARGGRRGISPGRKPAV